VKPGIVQGLLCQSRKALHQATLPASGIIFVDDTLLRGSVQLADGLEDSSLRGGLVAGGQNDAGFADGGTGVSAHNAVINAAFFVLPVSLNLRLNVSQSTSSEKIQQSQGWILHYPACFVKNFCKAKSQGIPARRRND
jgi:hypothetical protein